MKNKVYLWIFFLLKIQLSFSSKKQNIRSTVFVFLMCLSFLFISCSKQEKNVLHVYNWSDYLAPELGRKFEKEYNCKLIFDYYDSNEAMFAKIKAGCTGYDVIFPSSYMADIMNKQKMLLQIDKSKIPNLKYIDKRYLNKTNDQGMKFSIPYVVSYSGIGYNCNEVKDIKPTWGMFSDEGYKNRITMFDDMREAIGAALKYLGYSLNTVNDKELYFAKIQMLKWKQNIAAYQVDEAKTSVGAGILLLIQMYNGDAYLMNQDNPNIKFVVPEEGTSIGVDDVVIPADAVNVDLAYKFINFLCNPKNAAVNMDYIGCICPNTKAYKLIDKNLYEGLTLPDSLLGKSEVIHDLGENNIKYVELWDEIKATSV
jgi:spermidine/putrescine transport system substrate-binding protein